MGLRIFKATGRASCRICDKAIEKDDLDVMFFGYQMERHFHKSCIDKEAEKIKKVKDGVIKPCKDCSRLTKHKSGKCDRCRISEVYD